MSFDPNFRYDVVHPVITTYASGKNGAPRRVFARATTTVGIRHVDGDLPVLAALAPIFEDKPLAYYGLEGALWACVGGTAKSLTYARKYDPWDSKTLARLLGYTWDLGGYLGDALRRSPVIAAIPGRPLGFHLMPDFTRGDVLSDSLSRRVLDDGREDAAVSVERFFAENVAISGGRVLIKSGDPLLSYDRLLAFPKCEKVLSWLRRAYPLSEGAPRAYPSIEVFEPAFFDPASRIDSYLQILPDQVRRMANKRLGLIAQPRSILPGSEADAIVTRLRGRIDDLAPQIWKGAVGCVSRSDGASLVEATYAIADDLWAICQAKGYVGPNKKSECGLRSLLDQTVRAEDRVLLALSE